MRRFTDSNGTEYDVVLGRESWGSLLALFVPLQGSDPVRQAPLTSSAYDQAMLELDALEEPALQRLLDNSTIKEEGRP
jgi:hypothetical protein